MFKNIKLNLLVIMSSFTCSFDTLADINVYGPGGPAPAMSEAAKQFTQDTGIKVNVTAGPTPQWIDKAKLDADLIYSGSEAMMSDLEKLLSEQIIQNSIEPLYLRPASILVRNGNPKRIKGFKNLANPNIKVLVTHGAGQVGMWEDIAGRTGNIQLTKSLRQNIAMYAQNTGIAKKAWVDDPSYDAWVVFNIWGVSHQDLGQIVPIEPELVIYRDMGVARTKHSLQNNEAEKFIAFLKSNKGSVIFKKMGWTR